MRIGIVATILLILISSPSFSQERFIKIDDKDIWINTIGLEKRQKDEPLVVFESGFGTPMDHWERLLDGVSELGPLLTYDRPGVGKSEPDNEMPTIKNVADKLLKILDRLEMEPPYLLVGHSLGGAYVRGFAVYYPEMLAGLVIIDPADFTETQKNKRNYYDVLGWNDERIDEELSDIEEQRRERTENYPKSLQEESDVLEALRESDFKEIVENPLPDVPVHIIAGGRFDMPERFRSNEYDNEALFRSKMKHRVARWTDVIQSVDKGMLFYSADAGHFVHYDDPDLVISSIKIAIKDYKMIVAKK